MKVWKVREITKLIRDDGWTEVRHKGSHRQYAHDTKPGNVTIHGDGGDDLSVKTARSILRQAGLEQ